MMDSVRMGLRFLRESYDRILLTPGDVPLFRPETVKMLLGSTAPLAVPVYSHMHGFPVCVDRDAAERLLENETSCTLEEAVRTCPAEKDWISVSDPGVILRTEGLDQKKEFIARHNELLLRPVVDISLNGEHPLYNEKLSTLLHLVDEKTWQKYIGRLDNSRGFTRFFALAILLPFFPDDTLCLLAGLTNMRADVFTVILLAGKPLTIAVYSAIYLYAGSLLAFAG